MPDASIVEALRNGGGRRRGRLAQWHPADLTGEISSALARGKRYGLQAVCEGGGIANDAILEAL